MEKTNIRYVTPEDIEDRIEFASVDVSFISLSKVLPPLRELLLEDAEVVCLIKPQFEAGREKVGKKGVVRDKKVHEEVIRNVVDFTTASGYEILGLDYSPVKGPEGNIEYLMHAKKIEIVQPSSDIEAEAEAEIAVETEAVTAKTVSDETIKELVEKSHMALDK